MHGLPLRLRQLIGLAGCALVLVLGVTLTELWNTTDWRPLLLVIPIALLDLLRVEIFPFSKGDHTAFTLGSLGLFLLASLFGPSWAVLAAALQMLLPAFRVRSPWYKTLYNTGFLTSAVWAAAHLVSLAGADRPLWIQATVIPLAVALYVLMNTGSVALAVALATNRGFLATWRSHFAWIAFQEAVLSLTGLMLGRAIFEPLSWIGLLLASPLFLLRLTYQNYVRSQAEHTQELEQFAHQLISTLASLVDARDSYTFGHATMVSKYATAMGEQLGYSPEQLERLRVGALLHDIGKVGVPEAILFKPGKLEPWEYELMKEHATIGYRIVSQIDRLRYPADIIHQHHEWWNGRGYPRGLKGHQILQDARIVGVADALESMMSDRPYRKGCSLAEAMAEIRRWSGTQFDPSVVQALEQVAEEKGAGFFVNSATLVEEGNGGIMSASRFRQIAANTAAPSAQTGSLG